MSHTHIYESSILTLIYVSHALHVIILVGVLLKVASSTILTVIEKFRYSLWQKMKFRYHRSDRGKIQVSFIRVTLKNKEERIWSYVVVCDLRPPSCSRYRKRKVVEKLYESNSQIAQKKFKGKDMTTTALIAKDA